MKQRNQLSKARVVLALLVVGLVLLLVGLVILPHVAATTYVRGEPIEAEKKEEQKSKKLDTKAYDAKMLALANITVASSTATTTAEREALSLWPVEAPYPKDGAILPFNRIVAYYGNFYSTKMGILGEFDEHVVLDKLKQEVASWEAADPATPVIPAIDYIAVTAQGSAGADGMYRFRMPDEHVQRAIDMARKVDGITVLEIQAGLASLQGEVEALESYLIQPDVHLALDPEFNMKSGDPPGDVIGTVSSGDVNRAAEYLATLVREHNLPPKLLVIHRFTQNMVTGYSDIRPLPEVQIVMVMDGWGFGAKKINTYNHVIYPEPVQFTGFKLFYKNDLKPPSTRLLTPAEILDLTPQPSYIQYQ